MLLQASSALLSVFGTLLATQSLLSNVEAASMDQWRSRSIYQIITDRFALANGSTTQPCDVVKQLHCGGSWQGIIKQLDYIQGMGFTAIWISPVVKNIEDLTPYGEGYHGFWTEDITKLNPHFGTEDDLKALTKALHDRDMYLMIDVVANNMAAKGPGSTATFTNFVPFNDAKYFHPFCYISNFEDPTNAQNCWLGNDNVSLPDLNTELPFVQNAFNTWGQGMIANFSIDGFRIDATKHVQKSFWKSFQAAVGAFSIGEVYDDSTSYVCSFAYQGLNSVLNFPMWYSIIDTLTSTTKPMYGLDIQYSAVQNNCQDPTLLGTFAENQDVSRFASHTKDMSLLRNAFTYSMLSDGIPIVYYGAEQGFNSTQDPQNREALWTSNYDTSGILYKHIGVMNTVRNVIAKAATYKYWSPYWTWKTKIIIGDKTDILVMRKGFDHSILVAVTNRGANAPAIGPYEIGDTNFVEGETIIDVVGCTAMTPGRYGVITITIPPGGLPMVWMAAKYLVNTTLCPDVMKSYKSSPGIARLSQFVFPPRKRPS